MLLSCGLFPFICICRPTAGASPGAACVNRRVNRSCITSGWGGIQFETTLTNVLVTPPLEPINTASNLFAEMASPVPFQAITLINGAERLDKKRLNQNLLQDKDEYITPAAFSISVTAG